MKESLNKRISALALSIVLMMAPMTLEMGPILLAANEEDTAGDNPQGATGADDQVSEPETVSETDNKDSSTKSKPAPLKSFKPSEEIAAEQAVDFPVDI